MNGCREFKGSQLLHGCERVRQSSRIKQNLTMLDYLIDYELRSARRYRRFVALLMLASANRSFISRVLAKTRRASDKLIDLGAEAVILMSETDLGGAMTAVERYKLFCSREADLRCAVAAFPADGIESTDLLVTVYRRLNHAKKLAWGAVVSTG